MTDLLELDSEHVVLEVGNGYYGWQEQGAFDAIIVPAVAGQILPPLLKQLKPKGKIIIPVGNRFYGWHSLLLEKPRSTESH